MKKNNYEEPDVEIIEFKGEDVISTSGLNEDDIEKKEGITFEEEFSIG